MNDLFKPVNPGLTLADINRKNRVLWGSTKDAPLTAAERAKMKEIEAKYKAGKMTNEELKKSGYAALFTRWQKEEENK